MFGTTTTNRRAVHTQEQLRKPFARRDALSPAQRAYISASQKFGSSAKPANANSFTYKGHQPNTTTASAMANAMMYQFAGPLAKSVKATSTEKAGSNFLQLASLFVGGPKGAVEGGIVQPHILTREQAMALKPREAAKYVFHGGSTPAIRKAWKEGQLNPSVPRDAGLMPHTRRDSAVWLARNPKEAADYASPAWHGHHEDGLVVAIPRHQVDPRITKLPMNQRIRGFGGDLSGTNLLIRGPVGLIKKREPLGTRSFRPGGPTINQMVNHIGRGHAPAHTYNPLPAPRYNPFRP